MTVHSGTIIEAAKDLLKEFGYFVDSLWHVKDVHFICEQHGLQKISDEEAMQVFMIAKEQFDGEVGISWPQLDQAVRTYVQKKTVLNSVHESDPV